MSSSTRENETSSGTFRIYIFFVKFLQSWISNQKNCRAQMRIFTPKKLRKKKNLLANGVKLREKLSLSLLAIHSDPRQFSYLYKSSLSFQAVFGSAAKSIVSFNSIGTSSNLPAKNLFAEDAAEKPSSAKVEEDGPTDYESIKSVKKWKATYFSSYYGRRRRNNTFFRKMGYIFSSILFFDS